MADELVFEYTQIRFFERAPCLIEGPTTHVMGKLLSGKLNKGDKVLVSRAYGYWPTQFLYFLDEIDDWLAMPFYDGFSEPGVTLFLMLSGTPAGRNLKCPGTITR